MALKRKIEDILADYWLNQNRYSGLSSYSLLQRLQKQGVEVSEAEIKVELYEMEKEELISTREIEGGDRINWVWKNNRFEKIIESGPHIDL